MFFVNLNKEDKIYTWEYFVLNGVFDSGFHFGLLDLICERGMKNDIDNNDFTSGAKLRHAS